MRLAILLRFVFVVFMVLAALMPFVPDQLSPLTVSFSFFFGLLAFLWMGKVALQRKYSLGIPSIALFCFFLSILLSAPIALANGVSFAAWARGAVPFIFLSMYFFIAPIRREKDAFFILNTLHLASIVWLIKILIIVIAGAGKIISGEVTRLTFLTLDLTLPYSLVGLTISLFNPDPRAVKWRGWLTGAFLTVIVGSAYRSQIILVIAVLIVYIFTQPRRKKITLFFLLFATGTVAISLIGQTQYWQDLVLRFQNFAQEGSSSRAMEIRYALQHFMNSPIVGNGLGYQIPAEVTFYGDWELIKRAVEVKSVGYIHNLWAYLLMDLGILGFLFYSSFTLGALINGCWEIRSTSSQLKLGLVILLISLLMFFTISASFRQIQSNIIIATLIALLWHRGAEKSPESEGNFDG